MACNDRFFAAAARLTAQPSRLANFALRLTTALSLCALLGACGFHLRSSATLPFESMFISGSPSFATLLGRAVRAGSSTRVTDNPKDAQVILQIVSEQNERVILSLSGSGRVRELQLRYRVSYRLNDRDSRELLPVGAAAADARHFHTLPAPISTAGSAPTVTAPAALTAKVVVPEAFLKSHPPL